MYWKKYPSGTVEVLVSKKAERYIEVVKGGRGQGLGNKIRHKLISVVHFVS